jgi:uncharacterized membrane protein required for colicin V production
MSLDRVFINWFDLVMVIALVVGIYRGRKHGMSEELLLLMKWLIMLFGCAFLYQPLGVMICQVSPVFTQGSANLMAYLAIGLIITAIFAVIRRSTGEKLVSSEVFGRSEFYLGMMAGMTRFGIMMIMMAAMLNARSFNQAEIKADIKYQNDVYGSTFFPKLYTVQNQVFRNSIVGPLIKGHLSFLLIEPSTGEKKELKRRSLEVY